MTTTRTLISNHHIPLHMGQEDEAQVRRIQPKSIKLVDSLARMPQFYELSPNSLFVYRDWALSEQKEDMFRDPVGTGQRHADDWHNKLTSWNHPIPREQVFVLGINEPPVWRDDEWVAERGMGSSSLRDEGLAIARQLYSGQTSREIAAFDLSDTVGVRKTVEYAVAFLDRLTEHGIRGGALNLSVGWPANTGTDTPPNWEPYTPVYDAIKRGTHILFLHEYWSHHGLDGPDGNMWGWWAGRALKCPWDVPIIIGECGIEEAVIGGSTNQGWLNYYADNPQIYVDQLNEYSARMSADPRIHSVEVFSWDFSPGFDTCDIRPLVHLLPENREWDNAIGPVQPPPPHSEFELRLLAEAEANQTIQYNPDARLQRAMLADGYMPNSSEFWFEGFIAQRSERLDAELVRVYYVEVGKWETVYMVDR